MNKIIWLYDSNHRIYVDDNGVRHVGPIYRKSWVEHKVVSETSKSWVLDNKQKITKNVTNRLLGVAFSELEVEQQSWVHDNAYKLSQAMMTLPYDKLVQVSDLVTTDKDVK